MRVQVPVAFPDTTMIILLAAGVVAVPVILFVIVNLIASIKKEEGEKRGLGKAFSSGIGAGLVSLLLVGSFAWALSPYLKGQQAFNNVKDYYQTNIVVPKSSLPVATFEEDLNNIEPVEADVYRVPGGTAEKCMIYVQNAEYVLYCGDPLIEFSTPR